jgi:hypothetical protein
MASLTLCVQIPTIQTQLVKFVTNSLSEKLQTKVRINAVNIHFFKSIELDGVYIEDQQSDTLLYVNNLVGKISLLNINKQKLIINDVQLHGGRIGLKRYKDDRKYNFDFLIDAFTTSDTSASNNAWDIKLENISLLNQTFSYKDYKYNDTTPCINFEDIYLTNLNIIANNFGFYKDSVTCDIKQIALNEKSGFKVTKMNAEAMFADTVIRLRNLHISTPNSSISGHYRMEFASFDDFDDYINKVFMRAEFTKSKLSSNDVQFFAKELFGLNTTIQLSGVARGTVNHLKLKNLDIACHEITQFKGSATIDGLPEIEKTFFNILVDEFISCKKDIERIPSFPFNQNKKISLPANFELLQTCYIKGKFTGFISDFVAYGNAHTALGFVSTDLNLKTGALRETYTGHLSSNQFDIGKFTGQSPMLGKTTINVNIQGQGFRFDNLVASVQGQVIAINFNGYNYNNIDVKGELARKLFKGSLEINDKNINLIFDGSVDYTGPEPMFRGDANLKYCYLTKLNLIDRDTSANVKGSININLSGDDVDNLYGSLIIEDLDYSEAEKHINVDNLMFDAFDNNGTKHFILKSNILDADIIGISRLSSMSKSIQNVIESYFPVTTNKYNHILRPEFGNFKIQVKDVNPTLAIFYPELTLDSGTTIEGKLNTENAQIHLVAISPQVTFNQFEFKNLLISAESANQQLGMKLLAQKFVFDDSLQINSLNTHVTSTRDSAWMYLYAATADSTSINLKLGAKAKFNSDVTIVNIEDTSQIKLRNSLWQINKHNQMQFSDGVKFENFKLSYGDNQGLILNGVTASKNTENKLNLTLQNFDLGFLNTFLKSYQIELGGISNGNLVYADNNNKIDVTGKLTIDSLAYYNDTLGYATFISDYNHNTNRIIVAGNIQGNKSKNIDVDGYYQIGKGKNEDELHFDCKLKRTSISLFEHYLGGLASNLNGMVSADLALRGTPKNPTLTGKGNLQKASFTIDYLNTRYTISDNFELTENQIRFDDITIYDPKGNAAKVYGGIRHKNLDNFELDVHILPQNMLILNTEEWQNNLYYGTAYATGKVDITGTFDLIKMKIALQSENGTSINLPLSTPEEVGQSGFISFVKHDTIKTTTVKSGSDLLGLDIDLELAVNNNAEIRLIFDSKIGDIINGVGNGDLRITVTNDGSFNLFGTYVIDKGSYYFTMQNLFGKYFELIKGGSVKWIGDPYQGIVDIQARYTRNAGLYDLLQDTSAQYKRKVPVEVSLLLKNQLLNPDITFKINVPNVDANTSNLIQRYLNTEEEINKQAMSLIVFNKFTTPSLLEGNRSFSNSSNVGASLSEFVTQQLSNWASQINSNFNVDISYTPGDVVTHEQYDIAVSTKLLDDRVKLTGTVGYGSNGSNNTTNGNNNTTNVVGDFLVEVDVSKDGRFKVRAFNKSNNNSLINSSISPYTQGVGWFYRKEFDKFGDLFRKKQKDVDTNEVK